MHDRPAEVIEGSQHMDLAKALFNRVWALLDTVGRSLAQDDEMVAAAHASFWHWLQVGDERNFERGHWLIARCCAATGRGAEALHHAHMCLKSCQQHDHGAFDLAFAHEAMARASIACEAMDDAHSHLEQAHTAGGCITSDDDKQWLEKNLSELRGCLSS
jgi:hypothetical protein